MRRRHPSHRHPTAVLLGLALSVCLLPGAAWGAEAAADYGVRTARIGDVDRSIDRFVHSLEPESSVTDGLEIFNFTSTPATFDVYPSDLVPSNTGLLAPAAREAEIVGAGAWITIEEPTVEVGPRGSALIEFELRVPPRVAPGEYEAAVLVEPHRSVGSGNIETRTRVGLRIEIEVLGEVNLSGVLGDLGIARRDGDLSFVLPMTNNGNVTFQAAGVVEISASDGELVSELSLAPSNRSLAPGEDAEFSTSWSDPPLFGRFEVKATVTAMVDNREPIVLSTEPVIFWIIPWGWIVGFLFIAVGGVWALVRARPRLARRARHRREDQEILRDFRRKRALDEADSPQRARRGAHRS